MLQDLFDLFRRGGVRYEAAVIARRSGRHGCTVRVLPHHPALTTPFLPGFIVWVGRG